MAENKCTNPPLGKKLCLYETGKLSLEEEIEFVSHLLECDYCFQEFSEMATAMTYLPEIVKRLKTNDRTGKEERILLFPRFIRGEKRVSNHNALRLIAKGDARISSFKLIGEYNSEDNAILLRVLENESTQEVIGYLLSEDNEKTENVMVAIEGIDERFLSSEKGIVTFGKNLRINFLKTPISLHTPVACFQLFLHGGTVGEEIMKAQIPLESNEHDRIILSIGEEKAGKNLKVEIDKIRTVKGKKKLHVVVKKENGEKLYSEAKEGIAVFEGLEGEKKLIISIFH
jgi:hypothetical protein